ncbi:RNA polymerase sigma factor [Pseudonocardia ailaonensis]|uniref:RNA polymerase sigma factor n=1 Tax=Pseudonocardia ailaonensis TaxID=367279 RepID=UPI0031D08BDC
MNTRDAAHAVGGAAARKDAGSRAPDSDEDILAALAAGRPDALAALYDRYGTRAFALAKRVCGDAQLAEDAVQEAFVTAWREAPRFDPRRGRVGTWLMTLVHHRAVDLVRREDSQRRRTVPIDTFPNDPGGTDRLPPDGGAGPEESALLSAAAGSVRTALAALPAEQRKALALAYFGGYTQREVAALTGVALGTVKSRMFTGLARLRTSLAALAPEGGAS